MIYIITWCILHYVSDPCPLRNTVDEFGRTNNSMIGCTVMHGHIEKDCNPSKTFTNREEAYSFYKRAQSDTSKFGTWFAFNNELGDVKIDSVVSK